MSTALNALRGGIVLPDVRANAERARLIAASPRRDWGFYGPKSVAWTLNRHPLAGALGGIRASLVEMLHPAGAAGLAQHSSYQTDPLGRAQRSGDYLATVMLADTGTAEKMSAQIKKIHERVQGIEPVTGRPYKASDPELALYIFTTGWHSGFACYQALGGRLSERDADRYFQEGLIGAELLGLPRDIVPTTRQGYRDFFEDIKPQLCLSEAGREVIDFFVRMPVTSPLAAVSSPIMRVLCALAVSTIPRYIRRLGNMGNSRLVDAVVAPTNRLLGQLEQLPGARDLGKFIVPDAYGYAVQAERYLRDPSLFRTEAGVDAPAAA